MTSQVHDEPVRDAGGHRVASWPRRPCCGSIQPSSSSASASRSGPSSRLLGGAPSACVAAVVSPRLSHDRPGRLQDPADLGEDAAQTFDPLVDRGLEPDLAVVAVVAQLEVRRAGDHAVDAGCGHVASRSRTSPMRIRLRIGSRSTLRPQHGPTPASVVVTANSPSVNSRPGEHVTQRCRASSRRERSRAPGEDTVGRPARRRFGSSLVQERHLRSTLAVVRCPRSTSTNQRTRALPARARRTGRAAASTRPDGREAVRQQAGSPCTSRSS